VLAGCLEVRPAEEEANWAINADHHVWRRSFSGAPPETYNPQRIHLAVLLLDCCGSAERMEPCPKRDEPSVALLQRVVAMWQCSAVSYLLKT
jgi:hypothetical protein